MAADFFDTNVILYLLDDGLKADRAEALLAQGGTISVQVLNEALVNCLRKARMSHDEAGEFLFGIRDFCETVELTVGTHDVGRALAARYKLSVCDSMIVAAALLSGCTRLWSEDMQDRLTVEGRLKIVNPFADAA
ncbi:PIN domain-containing protein [Rhodovulum kholense]|uniref:Putative nucleic acid-binding protein n=1 Tax=Rhodovulum kholense TaxID=453584 RepID=A0A8E3ANT1_9RHOB|nr:PIN domain-containing protein [Rhodovulum kholense]PTW37215.1 putative nucleic acid-binding protein [Rhodovulum kholense]